MTESAIEKLDMSSPNLVSKNFEIIAALFPNCVSETAEGKAIDFDLLKQELNSEIVEGSKERYRLEWPGKKEAIVAANLPTTKTLRPVREDSVDFDNTENLYIEGDNLEVLKLLQESYSGKIQIIYIDPPYNTGNDFVYNDSFKQDVDEFEQDNALRDENGSRLIQNPSTAGRYHSDWMTMIYPRLKLARNLLSDDGIIFISIDDNEIHNLRKITDEIFGENAFIEQITWKNKYGAGAKTKGFIGVHEYILCYSKQPLLNLDAPLSEEDIKGYNLKDEKYSFRGGYITQPLATTSMGDRPNLRYPIHFGGEEIWPEKQWVWAKDRLYKAIENNEVVIKKMDDGNFSVRSKQYVKDENGNYRKGKPLSIFNGPFNQDGTKEVKDLFDNKAIFDFPKPTALLKYLFSFDINNSTKKDQTILDFFSGSASTAQAVMNLNLEDNGKRKYILVQLPESISNNDLAFKEGYRNICEIGKERIRRAGKKVNEEVFTFNKKRKGELDLKTQDPAYVDTGFRVYRIDESNMQDVYYRPQDYQQENLELFVDNVKPGRSAEDLLTQIILDWGLPLSYRIEQLEVLGKQVFKIAENSLIVCFDKGIDEAFAKEIAKYEPLRIVFRDASFKDDTAKENVKQLLKQLSPETEMRVI